MYPTVHPDDELIDIVDDNDCVIATEWRLHAEQQGLRHRRIVLAFIINKYNKIAILRRTPDKRQAPSCLAIVGGGVQSGEDYLTAIKREMVEEVMLDSDRCTIKEIDYRKPDEDRMGYFKKIYEVRIPHETISFNQADFCELYWLTPQELFDRMAAGDKEATDLQTLVRLYYGSNNKIQ